MKHLVVIAFLISFSACNSSKKTFSPRPNNIQNDFNFFVLGDWGRDGKFDQTSVANQMIEKAKQLNPSFILLTGDNFYEAGVKSITDPKWKTSFENIYKDLCIKYPWYASLGNHDYRGNIKAQIDYHKINSNWNMPERYYSKVISIKGGEKLRIICIDTSPYYSAYYSNKSMAQVNSQDTAAQTRWLEKTLKDSKEEWKIVFGHHPVYSASQEGGTAELIKTLVPLFEKYKVQAYFCGHTHNLQHDNPYHSYTDYFVSGAGSEVKDNPKFNKTEFAESTAGFADIRINGDSLFLQFIDKSGKEIYHFAKSK